MEELLLRLKAILRRTPLGLMEDDNKNTFNFGQFNFDYNQQLLTCNKSSAFLTPPLASTQIPGNLRIISS